MTTRTTPRLVLHRDTGPRSVPALRAVALPPTAPSPATARPRHGRAVAALAAAGLAWGTSVPLSKAALGWLGPGWLTAARFALAAAVLLVIVHWRARNRAAGDWTARNRMTGNRTAGNPTALRRALRWPVLAWGAVGLGGSVMIQNAGLARTSVTHAALLVGTAPILVAVIAAAWRHTVARPLAWAGFALSLAGVGVIAGGQGGGATPGGDVLVLVATLLVAAMTVAQGRLLQGQDPVALTAVQFLGAAVAAVPLAACAQGLPSGPPSGAAVLAVLALTVAGTVVPFTLFAYGQRQVSTEVAGAFLNLEPLVGVLIGILAFGDPAGLRQLLGGAAVLGGIALSSLPAFRGRATRPQSGAEPQAPVPHETAAAGPAAEDVELAAAA